MEYRALEADATEFAYVLLPEGVACYERGRYLGLIGWGRPQDSVVLDPDGSHNVLQRMLIWVAAREAA